MAKVSNIKGLQNFISEIRAAGNKEAEKVRVDKELGKIRKKFAADKGLSEYDKKKYVWKLLYIYMLGYPVEFGHKQASDLIAAQKYAEKQVGYMACSILLNERDDFIRLITNSVRNDLICRNEAFQCLALNFIGSVGGPEFAALLLPDVQELLTNGAVRPIVRKKAALALLRLLRKSTSDVEELLQHDVWSVKINALFEEPNLGVLLGTVTLLLGIVSRNYEGYEAAVPKLVRVLEKLRARDVSQDYTYYGIASPWLQVKCLRVLQYFPPPADPAVRHSLTEMLKKIISGNEVPNKNINKSNAQHAIVFEAIALAIAIDAGTELLSAGVGLLGRFIGVREPNLKYLGLENMVRLAEVPAVMETVSKHQKAIIGALKEGDISIRRRALDLMFTMCNAANAVEVVDELLKYLVVADFSMREEIVLKTAVLAERFHPSLQWYVDSMLTLIERAGEFATKDIWYSTVQLITNHDELHEYAAGKVVEGLRSGASGDALLGAAAYILGEYGPLLKDHTLREQFALLQLRFASAPSEIKASLLSAYLKMQVAANEVDPALAKDIQAVFTRYQSYMDAELQQRAVEYGNLATRPAVAKQNVLPMPHWEKRKSLLLRRLADKQEDGEEQRERPTWMQPSEDGGGGVPAERAIVAVGVAPGSATAADAAAHAADANGAAPPEPEPEPEPAPAPAPVVVDDLLIGLDDGPLANGHAQPRDPMDALLSDGPGPIPQQPMPAPVPQPPADPFAARILRQESTASAGSGGTSSPLMAAPAAAAAAASAIAGAALLTAAPQSPASAVSSPSTARSAFGAAPPGLPPPAPVVDAAAAYQKLLLAASGVLYEDTYLQVGLKSSFLGPHGQLVLFLGNKSPASLTSVVVAVPPVPQLAFQLGPVPHVIESRKQVQIPLNVTAMAAFVAEPRLQLGYQVEGHAVGQSLALPVAATKFCSPPDAPLPRDLFFSQWRALVGQPMKLSERVVRTVPLPEKAPISALLAGLRLGELPGLDPVPANFVAAATLALAPALMAPQQIPVLVRIEVDTSSFLQFQVTVATPDAAATAAIRNLLCSQIAALNA